MSSSSKPGIVFVTSKVLNPSILKLDFFGDWYENRHIQEVQATGGISGAQRYESLAFYRQHRKTGNDERRNAPSVSSAGLPDITNQNIHHDFLTVYHMPDLEFRKSATFKGLAGQSKPNERGLLETIFQQAEFCTRFCQEVDAVDGSRCHSNESDDANGSSDPEPAAPFVITVGVPSTMQDSKLPTTLSKLDGFKHFSKYDMQEGSVLSAFQRSFIAEPKYLFIFQYGVIPDMADLKTALENAPSNLEIGFWLLRRDYDGTERTPAPWKVPEV